MNKSLTEYNYICPFINQMVDNLYIDELNNLITKTCNTNIDKRTFMMFIMMYFFTFLNINENSNNDEKKQMLKIFMSELIMNSEKRSQCINLYEIFEKNITCKIESNKQIKHHTAGRHNLSAQTMFEENITDKIESNKQIKIEENMKHANQKIIELENIIKILKEESVSRH